MKVVELKVDRKARAAHFSFEPIPKGAVVENDPIEATVVFDFASDGRLLGIEIVSHGSLPAKLSRLKL